MSVKVMGQIWDLDLPHNKMLVLLAMADHADHEGKSVRPSVELVAWKTGYEERQVRRIIHSLEQDRLLIVEKRGGGRKRPTEYAVVIENGVKKSPFEKKEDILTGNPEKRGHFDRESEEKVDILTGNPDENLTSSPQNPDIAMSPEPSLRSKNKRKRESKKNSAPKSGEPLPSKFVPEDFVVSPEMYEWANKNTPGVAVDYQTDKFRDWEFKDPHSDWNKTWRTWMRRAWENLPEHLRKPKPENPKLRLAY